MALQAQLIEAGGPAIRDTAGAALVPGEVVLVTTKLAGVVAGLNSVASGALASFHIGGVFDVAAASGTTFTKGVQCDWNNTTNLAVAAAAGDFELGKVIRSKVSGELVVRVLLNYKPA